MGSARRHFRWLVEAWLRVVFTRDGWARREEYGEEFRRRLLADVGCLDAYDARVAADAEQDARDASLTPWDRCDRCGAEAQRRVRLEAGDLLFCLGHYTKHADALARAVKVPRRL